MLFQSSVSENQGPQNSVDGHTRLSCEGYCPLQWHIRNSGHEGLTSHNDNFMLQTPTDFSHLLIVLSSRAQFLRNRGRPNWMEDQQKIHLKWRNCVLYNEISAVLAVKVPPCTMKTSYSKHRPTSSLKSPAHCALFQTPVSAKQGDSEKKPRKNHYMWRLISSTMKYQQYWPWRYDPTQRQLHVANTHYTEITCSFRVSTLNPEFGFWETKDNTMTTLCFHWDHFLLLLSSRLQFKRNWGHPD